MYEVFFLPDCYRNDTGFNCTNCEGFSVSLTRVLQTIPPSTLNPATQILVLSRKGQHIKEGIWTELRVFLVSEFFLPLFSCHGGGVRRYQDATHKHIYKYQQEIIGSQYERYSHYHGFQVDIPIQSH